MTPQPYPLFAVAAGEARSVFAVAGWREDGYPVLVRLDRESPGAGLVDADTRMAPLTYFVTVEDARSAASLLHTA